ncbi:hypothetical protein DRO26_01605 [Candidatus Bathyarchaeota archaeon]|nr:MAG: hypothetical protein DRO26_01605 [Candidatus Bathyarchaeota archaeon]
MVVVVVFDVDGTLESGNPAGPIKLETVRKLKEKGLTVGIVGAYERVQDKLSNLDFYFGGDPYKPENLRKIREKYKPTLAVYVADLPTDRNTALKTGFCYIRPEDFTLPEV